MSLGLAMARSRSGSLGFATSRSHAEVTQSIATALMSPAVDREILIVTIPFQVCSYVPPR
jgi:hypothetical protein